MSGRIGGYNSGAANLAASTGRVLLVTAAGGGGSGTVALSGAAGAVRPIGILKDAENVAGGIVSVVEEGYAFAIAGGVLTVAATTSVGSDINGAIVPIAAGAGVWAVGYFSPENGTDSAAGDLTRIIVDPHFVAVS